MHSPGRISSQQIENEIFPCKAAARQSEVDGFIPGIFAVMETARSAGLKPWQRRQRAVRQTETERGRVFAWMGRTSINKRQGLQEGSSSGCTHTVSLHLFRGGEGFSFMVSTGIYNPEPVFHRIRPQCSLSAGDLRTAAAANISPDSVGV